VRQLLRAAGQALDVRHQGLRRFHHCRRCSLRAGLPRRRRRRREVLPSSPPALASLRVSRFGLRLRCCDSPGLWALGVSASNSYFRNNPAKILFLVILFFYSRQSFWCDIEIESIQFATIDLIPITLCFPNTLVLKRGLHA
jgi:hypothetical protein